MIIDNLSLLSFVGIDQKTDFDYLLEFKKLPLKSEFSVLYSDSKNEKEIRYPGHNFCHEFLHYTKSNQILGSLHLCGNSVARYLQEDDQIIELCQNASRIQLNFDINKYSNYSKLFDNLLKMLIQYGHHIILQQNDMKNNFNHMFLKQIEKSGLSSSISILYDSSLGYGRKIENILSPYEKYFTGYAGGINKNNIKEIIDSIEKVNNLHLPYYLDLETGARINNLFSIEACFQIINDIIET